MEKIDKMKEEILEKTREYYQIYHNQKTDFVPSESRINYAGRVFDEKELLNLVDSSLEFWLTYGRYSKRFEKDLADFLGLKYALLVNSGSSANLLAFMALTSPLLKERRINRGDEVITVAAGFPTTVAPVIQYGAVPVFVDIDMATYNINVSQIEKAITSRTKALMVAHTLGNPFDIASVKALCEKHNLWLIEDNCDALGSKYDDKYTGTWGDIGTSSFYPPHHMTMGEGGAVYTNNPLLNRIMLSIRDWGRACWCDSGRDNTCNHRFSGQFGTLPFGYDHKYVYSHFGYNTEGPRTCRRRWDAPSLKSSRLHRTEKKELRILRNRLKQSDNFFYSSGSDRKKRSLMVRFMLTIADPKRISRNGIVEFLEARSIQTEISLPATSRDIPASLDMKEGRDYRISSPLVNTTGS
jgi:CDP-6-deoxy-D-xylo-4-hexulose-3-dehydrase